MDYSAPRRDGWVGKEADMSLFIDRPESDQLADVEEAARVRLQLSPYRAVRRVSCELVEGTLFLSGRVPTYHYKQLAQVAVVGIDGIQRIVNDIEVESGL
jgi:osmotically-inducible protein OsmY